MTSSSITSSEAHEPATRPPALISQVDLRALAKTTRKTLERLAPFSHMRTSSSETSPSLTKIINKINRYVALIDSSMLCQQLGYQLAKNCMVLCDPEPDVGLNTPGGNTGVATRGRGGVGVSGQLGAADAYGFGHEDARELAGKGHEIALKVKEGFSGIAHEMYKIAASTKDDMLLVLVTPDPTHSKKLKIYLKDVGTKLVASLSHLSEFSKAVTEVADWWSSVKDDLALEASALLAVTQYERWSKMKVDFQEYYDVINIVHLRFPELLPSSISAWQSVASARNLASSSTGHSEITLRSQNQPVLARVDVSCSNGHAPMTECKHGCATPLVYEKAGKQRHNLESAHPASAGRAVYLESGGMWQNGQTLRYCFLLTCPGTPYQQNKVKRVIKEWEKYANITFEYVDAQDATIRITFDQGNGSWSFIGRDVATVPVDEPTMNLGWIGNTEDISDTDTGVILHEFGHALGLGHEHQSPVRDSALKLKEEPTKEYYMRRKGWDEKGVRDQILKVYNKEDVTNYSKLDLESIMMYPMPSAMNEQNRCVKPNNRLSQLDKAYVSINYPREVSDNNTNRTVEYALNVAGVDMGTRERILRGYRKGGWAELRKRFGEWCNRPQDFIPSPIIRQCSAPSKF